MILANPEEVVEWSTAQLALRADTATATVIRACQSLGFRGFQHLRLELERSTPLLPREQDDIVSGAFMTVCTGRTVTNLRDLRQGGPRPLLRHLRTDRATGAVSGLSVPVAHLASRHTPVNFWGCAGSSKFHLPLFHSTP